MKAFQEIGVKKSIKFIMFTFIEFILNITFVPQIRVALLRLMGAKIGRDSIIHRVSFINLYRGGFTNLKIGDYCFIGRDALLDLSDKITFKNHVTMSARAMIFTHMNIGYKDHPLQKIYPAKKEPVFIGEGTFIGAGTIILAGSRIGTKVIVGAGSLVNKDIKDNSLVVGAPAKEIKKISS